MTTKEINKKALAQSIQVTRHWLDVIEKNAANEEVTLGDTAETMRDNAATVEHFARLLDAER
jgi:DNA-binding XRE family transcriptional regulator